MTTYESADRAVEAYDRYIFAAPGREYNEEFADTLAAIAAVECDTAAHDRTVNAFTRRHYRRTAEQFWSICA